MSPLRIVALLFMLAALIVLFALDNSKLLLTLVIVGNILALIDNHRERTQ